ncbi:hypothetical protein HU200_063253 [Digitaria exilis]|uniref:Purine permease 11 n=1 Tax=Digitaria exilis TaxID=1010633 RepID=A0A835DZV0_9POAL|nr:hypothetical protein HU200_063253 [Digitaria exilis]
MIYVVLGLIMTADDMMYSHGLMYLPVSTYSLICASQLGFNVIFSYVLNSQKLTGLIMNSVVLLTLSDLLIGANQEYEGSTGVSRGKYLLVLNMQIYTALVATFASLVGLFASGEWKDLKGEMDGFQSGQFSYLMTLVWTSVSWQVASIGMMGLIFEVSSLFSNVISTFALPIVPLFGVMVFHDKMNGVKIIAMIISMWGFFSYVYQQHLDVK